MNHEEEKKIYIFNLPEASNVKSSLSGLSPVCICCLLLTMDV